MTILMKSIEQREVLRCEHCFLVQFRTASVLCRRCHKSLVEALEPVLAPLAFFPAQFSSDKELQIASRVRNLRHVRNLSQRQVAARMNAHHAYISKIENGKVALTISSLERLSKALEVDISALLGDAKTCQNEVATFMKDPFLANIAVYSSKLDSLQRSIFLNHVRELSARYHRSA